MAAAGVITHNDTIDGPHGTIPVRRYSPPEGTPSISALPIVWVHGGAFVSGDLDQPESHVVALELAKAGFPVVTVDYRLAKYSPIRRPGLAGGASSSVHFPVPVDDVLAVVEEVQRNAPHGVILGGASAGACLSASVVLRLAERGAEPPKGLFLVYGTFHAKLPKRPRELVMRIGGRRRWLHTPRLIGLLNLYYAGSRAALRDPFAFPGGHPLRGFPPTLLVDADLDAMRASGSQFARELSAYGVPVDYRVIGGTTHAFMNRPSDPGFEVGMRAIVDWVRRI
jgi:acetyl esterase